ncbi:MAG: insulinase family protein [Rhizobiaceae bacterium]|nr:insulinase family protein [Rhizobiaceae bacterium]
MNRIDNEHVTAPVHAALVVFFAAYFFMLAALAPARAETAIQEVRSTSGVTAWLVEDYSVPIIAVKFIFEGGTTQDPAGKEGLMTLMSGLFDEGAGDLDSDAFQLALDDAGAEMGFSAGLDGLSGSMRMLEEKRREAFDLLALAVNRPRFDQAPMDRIRAQLITGIEASARDPETQAGIAFSKALYGDHPYARRSDGTPETLRSMTADDLRTLHRRIFARGKMHVGVVGAIDAATLAQELDRVFGNLPAEPELTAVPEVTPKFGQEVRVDYPLPQTTIRLAYPGVKRDDPDFFAAFLMNHVLGGGTFSSRLFDEVREKRGLTYGIGSGLSTPKASASLSIGTSTNADRAAETLSVIREVVAKMAAEGPTEEELADAKRYLIGSYAINNLDSSSAIASTLVGLQVEGLGIDYIRRRPDLIGAVTREQAAAMAKRLLSVDPAVLILGPAADGG